MADITRPLDGEGAALLSYKDRGDGTYAPIVALGGLDTTVTLTGDVVVDTLGALNNAKVVDPDAASATIPALLRGLLAELVTLNAAMVTANAALATIVTNTAH